MGWFFLSFQNNPTDVYMYILTGRKFFWHLSRQLKESSEYKYVFRSTQTFLSLFFPLLTHKGIIYKGRYGITPVLKPQPIKIEGNANCMESCFQGHTVWPWACFVCSGNSREFSKWKKKNTKKRFAVNISQTMTKYLIKYNYSETV